jgi:prevent-host-death family protein
MPTKTVSATDAKNRFGGVLHEVNQTDEPIVVEKDGKPVAVILSMAAYERLENPKRSEYANLNFSAEWDDGDGRAGVHAGPKGFTWWYRPNGPGGRFGELGSDQTFEEFLTEGPRGAAVPEHVLSNLESIIKANKVTNSHRQGRQVSKPS